MLLCVLLVDQNRNIHLALVLTIFNLHSLLDHYCFRSRSILEVSTCPLIVFIGSKQKKHNQQYLIHKTFKLIIRRTSCLGRLNRINAPPLPTLEVIPRIDKSLPGVLLIKLCQPSFNQHLVVCLICKVASFM